MSATDEHDFWATPLARSLEREWARGVVAYVHGLSRDHKRALIIVCDPDGTDPGRDVPMERGFATIAPTYTANGLGRWECSRRHYHDHSDLYRERFPCTRLDRCDHN